MLSLTELGRDARLGLRSILRRPGFAVAVILSLVLGIGLSTTVFTLLDIFFLRPVPGVEEPEGLVDLRQTVRNEAGEFVGENGFAYLNFLDYQRTAESFSDLALHQWYWFDVAGGTDRPERITGAFVSASYFDLLGLTSTHGRFFTAEEDSVEGSQPVAVLSHGFWSRQLGADPDVIGREMYVNGRRFVIVGVAAAGFKGHLVDQVLDIWVPMTAFPALMPSYADQFLLRDVSYFPMLGRLAPGVSMVEAEEEMMALSLEMSRRYIPNGEQFGVSLGPFEESTNRDRYLGYMKNLAVAVLLLLLNACFNVANLLVVRGLGRRREIALRQAIGGSRSRVARTLLIENLMLFGVAGVAALGAARLSLDLLWRIRPPDVPSDAVGLGLGGPVLVFALVLVLVTGLTFGGLPAWSASRTDLLTNLKGRSAGLGVLSGGPARFRLSKLLVIGQVALALVALIGAGLLIKSLLKTQQIDLGFETELAVVTVSPGRAVEDEERRQLYRRILEEVRAMPGVEAAAFSENRLLRGAISTRQVYVSGRPDFIEGGGRESHRVNIVTQGFFSTAGIPLVGGRDFDPFLRPDAPKVAIVNQFMAQEVWPGEDPIGKRFHFDYPDQPPIEVIGVAADAKYRNIREGPQFFIYLPLAQHLPNFMVLHVRTAGRPAAAVPALQQKLWSIDPDLVLSDVGALSEHIDTALWAERTSAALLSLFALLSLALAAVGVYGVMSYTVNQRRQELSLRIALGSRRSGVARAVLGEACAMIAAGIVVGWALAYFLLSPLLASQLQEVSPNDPATFALQSVWLVVAAILGSLVPLRRALKSDPMALLKSG